MERLTCAYNDEIARKVEATVDRQASHRRTFRVARIVPQTVSRVSRIQKWAAALCLVSWLKGEIYRLCIHVHAEQYLARRRNTPVTEQQTRVVAETIERIRSAPVPGLPSISQTRRGNGSSVRAPICR